MNRQSKNTFLTNDNTGRNQSGPLNVKNNLKPYRSGNVGNNAKTSNSSTKSSAPASAPVVYSTSSVQQSTIVGKNEINTTNVQSKPKVTSAISLTSYANFENKKYQNKIPEKRVFSLRDIQKKDIKQNIKFDVESLFKPPSSKETKDLSATKLIEISKRESKTKEKRNDKTVSVSKLNLIKAKSDENVTDFDKKKQLVMNILKKIKENSMKSKKRLYEGKLGNRENANRNDLLIPITPELMQSLQLQPADITTLLQNLQYKLPEHNKSPTIKFSSEPFVKLKRLNTKRECTDTKILDTKTKLKTQNTNIVNETDCFISKVQGHFIDRSLYNADRKSVVAPPTLSTIIEEPAEPDTAKCASVI